MSGIIYKIENKKNGKVYIGLTTTSLNKRWNGHKTSARKCVKKELVHPLYNAMAKYGIENFEITKIDESDNLVELGQLERKYIREYKSTDKDFGYNITRGGESNQLDANPRTKLTVDDVKNIRIIYNDGKIGPSECWKKFYEDKISYSAFEKIYEGTTWVSVMPEVYTIENKRKHLVFSANHGDKNGNAIMTNEEVYEVRKYYVNHTLQECFEKFGNKFSNINAFRSVIDVSYNNVPMYSKKEKKWYLNNEHSKRMVNKKNVLRFFDDIIEIDTFDGYGEYNGTFITNIEYKSIIMKHKWSKFNGKICTNTNRKILFLHKMIMGDNGKRVYYINGDSSDVRKENLTNSISEYKIKQYGLSNFMDLVYDNNISLREIGRKIGLAASSVKRYMQENNIEKCYA